MFNLFSIASFPYVCHTSHGSERSHIWIGDLLANSLAGVRSL